MSWIYLALAFFATVSFCGMARSARDAMRTWSAWMIANMPEDSPSKIEEFTKKMLDISGPDNAAR